MTTRTTRALASSKSRALDARGRYVAPDSAEQARFRARLERLRTDDTDLTIEPGMDVRGLGTVVNVTRDGVECSGDPGALYQRDDLTLAMAGQTTESIIVSRVLAAINGTVQQRTPLTIDVTRTGTPTRVVVSCNIELPVAEQLLQVASALELGT